MDWYYQQNDAAQGPVSEETFRALIAGGLIRPDTLVWHDGMAEWLPLSVVEPGAAGGPAAVPPPQKRETPIRGFIRGPGNA